MFHTWTIESLQLYWWAIIALLGGLFAFMTFVQGGQTLIDKLGRNEEEKTMIIASLGLKWEIGFTTLVLFGGALFAAFPLFYATSFGGAYWVWLGILFTFVLQAVSYEFRKKENNFLGQKTYEVFMKINGWLGVFLIGAALSTLVTGADYKLNDMNFVVWQSPLRGLEALFDFRNYFLPIALIFLARILAAMYFINNIHVKDIQERCRTLILREMFIFLPFFLAFVAVLLLTSSRVYDPNLEVMNIVEFGYLKNLISNPVLLVLLLVGVVLVLVSFFMIYKKVDTKAIFFGGVGTVLTVTIVLFTLGVNNTSFYPSNADIDHSLTLLSASSSHYTLSTMAYVSLLVPFVLGYIVMVWRALDRQKITKDGFDANDPHNY
ncbi:MAG: cytochrome d ubiquinol oxidase subunit II [Campylobacteraceae bacterium]